MASLQIIDQGSGQSWRVWPDAEPLLPGSIQETASYIFELRDCAGAADAQLAIDDDTLEALRTTTTDTARWRWSPGFHAGTIDAEIRLSGAVPRRFEITTDPDRRKLTRDAFDTMVAEILDDTFALFSLSSFRKSVARGAGTRPPPVARLEYLRSRINDLEEVTLQIAKRPRRSLSTSEVALPYHQATRATGPEVIRSFQSGCVLRETGVPSRLPAPLKGFLPAQLRLRQRRSSLDLPEHRQMAACLRSWTSWLSAAADILECQNAMPGEAAKRLPKWAQRCRQLSRRVNGLAALAPFAGAGTAPAHLVLSALFRNGPLYRRFYRLWQDLNAGIAAVFGDFLNLPLARTYELYELWCYLRLLRAATSLFGSTNIDLRNLFIADANGGITIAGGAVTVRVGSEWTLCFQRKYQEFWKETDGRGSFSRVMIPDVVAAWTSGKETGSRLIVLDAKYRISSGLNDALSSIHAYRDALVEEAGTGQTRGIVTAAYLLAPYIPALASEYRETTMPNRLFHPEYRRGFRFGALTLKPGMSNAAIAETLRLIVADATASDSEISNG